MFTVHGKALNNSNNIMDAIATYMDDDIRETVHAELAPCTNDEFIARYLELDPDFEELLVSEFSFREVDTPAELEED